MSWLLHVTGKLSFRRETERRLSITEAYVVCSRRKRMGAKKVLWKFANNWQVREPLLEWHFVKSTMRTSSVYGKPGSAPPWRVRTDLIYRQEHDPEFRANRDGYRDIIQLSAFYCSTLYSANSYQTSESPHSAQSIKSKLMQQSEMSLCSSLYSSFKQFVPCSYFRQFHAVQKG